MFGDTDLFELGSVWGSLLCRSVSSPLRTSQLPCKVEKAIALCNDPYQLMKRGADGAVCDASQLSLGVKVKAKGIARRLVRYSQFQFLLARVYASWRQPLFENAKDANIFFRRYTDGDQTELCFARALFIAKTSRNFRSEGVVIIGVFLPSRSMHAWVIERGEVADLFDDIWINYQPVAILA